jgi:hypothetical protein
VDNEPHGIIDGPPAAALKLRLNVIDDIGDVPYARSVEASNQFRLRRLEGVAQVPFQLPDTPRLVIWYGFTLFVHILPILGGRIVIEQTHTDSSPASLFMPRSRGLRSP